MVQADEGGLREEGKGRNGDEAEASERGATKEEARAREIAEK